MRLRTRAVDDTGRFRAVAVGLGIAVAIALVVGVPEIAQPVTSCALGSDVGSAWIWTPSILVNVPLGGSAAWASKQLDWTIASGSLVIVTGPGSGGGTAESPGSNETGINGVVGLAEWSLYRVQNVSSAFGTGSPCGQPFVAEIDTGLSCGAWGNLSTILVLPDNASDLNQPHFVPPVFPQHCPQNATPGASLWFDTVYPASTTGTSYESEAIRLCGPTFGPPFNVSLAGAAEYPVAVSMPVSGGTIHSVGYLRWEGPAPSPTGLVSTAEYSLPNGWVWNISAIEPGVLPTIASPSTTSLLAFERLTC